MDKRKIFIFLSLALAMVVVSWGGGPGVGAQAQNGTDSTQSTQRRGTTVAQRMAAKALQAPQRTGVSSNFAGLDPQTKALSPLAAKPSALAVMSAPLATPDYFGVANYANSPLPTINPITKVITGGMHKFVDTLPGFCGVSPWGTNGANDLGQCIPIATADTTTFPGSDFYRIGLAEYNQQMHSDLPATKLRGYVQLDVNDTPVGKQQYLGPLILAKRNTPVRVLFENKLAKGSSLFIPVDTTYMGAGNVDDGVNMAMASQNRATLHLHGGNTPWISDGTPHQWITPVGGDGEPKALGFAKGFSFQNVPDMVGKGKPIVSPRLTDGKGSFYWTNQQSGRLMFYHDHAYGITRLNVYAGEAAGYLIADPVEEDALSNATVPGTLGALVGGATAADTAHLVPLVIQDKTFVPDNGTVGGQLAATDPTWDVNTLGGAGSLWFPHVYTPNQNPSVNAGANAFGRWDYGPWFWPPQDPSTFVPGGLPVPCTSVAYPGQPLVCPGTPNPSGTPEAFMDTPVVNGTAYPYLKVARAAYRFQILAASNDRTWNLGLYYAATATGTVCKGGAVADLSLCTEVSMVPADPHTALSTPPACTIQTATGGSGLAIAALNANGDPLNGTGLPGTVKAPCWPSTWPADARDGGVPNPATAGPPLIQIGTEGGLLPEPAVIPSTPIGYDYNRRSITVLNVLNHGLLLGPAERADVIIDFSKVPGKSVLILYNDGPAPVPGFDPRNDYYTGNPDLTASGGAPSTQPGYGPNIRTVMQFRVTGPSTNIFPFSLATLQAATGLPAAFKATQDQIIVPESAYNMALGTTYSDTYSRISDTSLTLKASSVKSVTVTNGGSGYTSAPAVTFVGGGGKNATGVATVSGGVVTAVTLTKIGYGYTSEPSVFFTGGGGTGAAATANVGNTIAMKPKTIQELFTLDYGRMNATLGVELPFTNFLTQTTIPYGYIDPPTELLDNNQPQIWKITHNGVDTHFIHFHLFTVQVINRVGWDGMIKPPDGNELSWKDTVRMNPLEDVIVALKPMVQTGLPWQLPNSVRPLDVTMPVGTSLPNQFTNVDPTNQPATVFNDLTNFGFEYVWHCHILGHEENDMMRAMVLAVAPKKPGPPQATLVGSGNTQLVLVSWKDTSLNETSFTVQRATSATGPWTALAQVPASAKKGSSVTYADTSVARGTTYYYTVIANNLVGYTRTYAAPAVGYPNTNASSVLSKVSNAVTTN